MGKGGSGSQDPSSANTNGGMFVSSQADVDNAPPAPPRRHMRRLSMGATPSTGDGNRRGSFFRRGEAAPHGVPHYGVSPSHQEKSLRRRFFRRDSVGGPGGGPGGGHVAVGGADTSDPGVGGGGVGGGGVGGGGDGMSPYPAARSRAPRRGSNGVAVDPKPPRRVFRRNSLGPKRGDEDLVVENSHLHHVNNHSNHSAGMDHQDPSVPGEDEETGMLAIAEAAERSNTNLTGLSGATSSKPQTFEMPPRRVARRASLGPGSSELPRKRSLFSTDTLMNMIRRTPSKSAEMEDDFYQGDAPTFDVTPNPSPDATLDVMPVVGATEPPLVPEGEKVVVTGMETVTAAQAPAVAQNTGEADTKSLPPASTGVSRSASMDSNFSKMRGKMVRFTEKSSIHVCPDDEYEVERAELWWTSEEMQQIRQECMDLVKEYMEDTEYLEAITKLFSSYKKSVTEEDVQHSMDKVADTPRARGLEMHIVPRGGLLCEKHRRVVLSNAASNQVSGLANTGEGWFLIRKESMKASRPCRQYAMKMAEHDAMEAIEASITNWDDTAITSASTH